MTKVYKAEIIQFCGSWGSGLGYLMLRDEEGYITQVSCQNSPTVRALEDAYGDVITEDHKGYKNQWIYWYWDDLGIMLGGFVPEEYANDALKELYEKTKLQ